MHHLSQMFFLDARNHTPFFFDTTGEKSCLYDISADKVARVCTTNITRTNHLKEDHHCISCLYNYDELPSNNSSLCSSHI